MAMFRRLLNSVSISTLLPKPRSFSTANTNSTTRYLIMKAGREYGDGITDDGKRAEMSVSETDSAVYVEKGMPGLGKEDVKVSVNVDDNTLSIYGLGGLRPYQTFLKLPPQCKNGLAMASMENGLLRVVVRKLKMDSPPGEEEGQNGKKGGKNEYVVGWHN